MLSYLLMYSSVDSCMCPDPASNPQPWHIGRMLQPVVLPSQGSMCFSECTLCVSTPEPLHMLYPFPGMFFSHNFIHLSPQLSQPERGILWPCHPFHPSPFLSCTPFILYLLYKLYFVYDLSPPIESKCHENFQGRL